MKPKQVVKICVDIAMTLGMLFLMGCHLWGDTAHEWAGEILQLTCFCGQSLFFWISVNQKFCSIWTIWRLWGRLFFFPILLQIAEKT